MERHGEAGFLYNPVNTLNDDELLLYAKVAQSLKESGEPDTRENGLRHLERIAAETVNDAESRHRMIANVIAFTDELAGAFPKEED